MRLISANALIELANSRKDGTVDANDIARFPTIEAEPVRHGRFVDGECENCGWFGDCVDVAFYNYCPNCGAKMDGAEPDDR